MMVIIVMLVLVLIVMHLSESIAEAFGIKEPEDFPDTDHKSCNVYLASPEHLARGGQKKVVDTDKC